MALPTPSEIKTSFQRHKQLGEQVAKPYRDVAHLGEQFSNGFQWGALRNSGRGIIRDSWFDNEGVPRKYVNICQGLVTTWSALLNKDRRSVIATALTPDDPDDIYVAEITNRFIDYFISEEETAAKIHQAVQFSFLGGTAGLKIWYDGGRDQVRWSRLTVHDYWIDPVEDYREAQWCIFENHYSEDQIAELWADGGIAGSPPPAGEYKNAAGETVMGVVGYEYWVRPNKKYPKGFFACIVNNQVVEKCPYPIRLPGENGKFDYPLPLVLMKVRVQRESAYGITPYKDTIGLQRSINEAVSRISKLLRIVTSPHLVLPDDLAESIDITETTTIGYKPNDKNADRIGWTQVPAISTDLYKGVDDDIKYMFDVCGLNEVTGGQSSPTLSGRAIEALYELDSQRNSDALKSLDDMVSDAWRLTIGLVQTCYTKERQAEISKSDVRDIQTFVGRDIQGKNIRFEASSELDRRTDVKTAKTVEEAQAGVVGAAEVDNARKTAPNAIAKKLAKKAVEAFIRGEDVEINAKDHSLPALREAIDREKARALSGGKRADFVVLSHLEMVLRDQLSAESGDPEPKQAPEGGAQSAGEQPAPTDTVTAPTPKA